MYCGKIDFEIQAFWMANAGILNDPRNTQYFSNKNHNTKCETMFGKHYAEKMNTSISRLSIIL